MKKFLSLMLASFICLSALSGLLRYILYHRRYPHLFIEPPQTELLPLPRAGVKEPVEPYRSPSSGPKWNMKNMLDKIRENIKDLF